MGVPRAGVGDEPATAVSATSGKIRAVTFDAGLTLLEPIVSVGEVYAEIAARNGCPNLSPVELSRRFVAVLEGRGNTVNTRNDWAEIVDATFDGLVMPPPSTTFFPQLFDHYTDAAAWRIYEDVMPALDELSRHGVRLGLISNWDDRLRGLLRAFGLAERFEVVAISCEVGHSKPAGEIFDSAASRLGLPPAEILHVGDSWSSDVVGAERAGFKAVQIARGSPAGPQRIPSLRGILAMVAGNA